MGCQDSEKSENLLGTSGTLTSVTTLRQVIGAAIKKSHRFGGFAKQQFFINVLKSE